MDSVYRKGLTIGDVKNRVLKVYEPIKKFNFVDKIIIQFKKGKAMKQDTYVVQIKGTDMYMIGYNPEYPSSSLFGNLDNAVEYDTLEAAEQTASVVGGGTVGTIKPRT